MVSLRLWATLSETKMQLATRLLLLVNIVFLVLASPNGAYALNQSVRADWEEDHFDKLIDDLKGSPQSLLRSIHVPASYELTSPYQVIPGSYEYHDNDYYQSGAGYNPNSIYAKYLASGAYQYHNQHCLNHYGQIPQVSQQDVDNSFGYANHELNVRFPEYKNLSHYSSTDHKEVEGQMMELVSEYFGKYKCFSKLQLATYLPVISVSKQYQTLNSGNGDISCTPYYDQHYDCSKKFASKYRTIDGSCNNRYRPYWGRSNICHIRLLPPDYSDGVQSFRLSKSGKPLPTPRKVSNYVTTSKDLKSYYTGLVLAFGQFINHDITNTANNKQNPNKQPQVDCCKKPNIKCVAIQIEDGNDYISSKFNKRCLNFVRSSPCPLCRPGPRQQQNSQTSFVDGSQIYGSTDKQAIQLRLTKDGLLSSAKDRYGKSILPVNENALPCAPLKKELKCFFAGDNRVNQHPLLLSMHTLWMRNHNHHAIKLKQVNPHWNDEQLYQEARRITVAELQHITYNEYLPVILGPLLSSYYNLSPLQQGYTNYEPYTDPSSWNEFTTAASRYGHSQIKDYYKTITANLANASVFLLKDNFFEPGFAWDGLIDDVIRGITSEPANTVDPFYSLTAKNFIMREKGKSFGLDLVSTNIVRGRDHGVSGYVHYLKACFNYDAKTWKDLEKFIPVEILTRLENIYSNIEDIDLYIAGVSERHFIDASVGPTFGCLIGIQFYHLKFGDRYFYEHANQHGSFLPAQLDNIRHSATSGRVLCRTGNNLQKIQPKPFYLPSGYNQLTDCAQFSDINYELWREQPHH